jgi:hypothetical protein
VDRDAVGTVVAFGVWLLGESLSSTTWVGLGCVGADVAAMTIPAPAPGIIKASN